jgi:hypothetical protein
VRAQELRPGECVVNGNFRCNLSRIDLNRQWDEPDAMSAPTVYAAKRMIANLIKEGMDVLMCIDLHGHSTKCNVFTFGVCESEFAAPGELDDERQRTCAAAANATRDTEDADAASFGARSGLLVVPDGEELSPEAIHSLGVKRTGALPLLMDQNSPYFAAKDSHFLLGVKKLKTMRSVVASHLGIKYSYTMEASFAGYDQGPLKGLHLNQRHLELVGHAFCRTLLYYVQPHGLVSRIQRPVFAKQ